MQAGLRWIARSVPRHWLLRPVLLLGLDGAITAASLWLALLLRFEGSITQPYLTTLPAFALLLVLFACAISLSADTHNPFIYFRF